MAEDVPSPDAVVYRSERTAGRTVAGKSLVVVIDRNELHTLNESGSFLWDHCQGKKVADLVAMLSERYGLDAERAQADVHTFLQSMQSVQALRLESA